MAHMLYDRLLKQGTISDPEGKPDPQFALPATVNWMRALAIVSTNEDLNFTTSFDRYLKVQKKNFSDRELNTIFEQLALSANHLSALSNIKNHQPVSDVARIGVMAWYYGISNAASAMICASDGSFHEDHAGTAKQWSNVIANQNKAIAPFDLHLSTRVKNYTDGRFEILYGDNSYKLTENIESYSDAKKAIAMYFKGTVDWYREHDEERLKNSKNFKDLGLTSFRTNAAKEMRDIMLANKPTCFLHQASRYRGKANYREALFLCYGSSVEGHLQDFVANQTIVLQAFLSMASAYCARRIGRDCWAEFVDDLKEHQAFSLDIDTVFFKR